jgi:hypothetical protein
MRMKAKEGMGVGWERGEIRLWGWEVGLGRGRRKVGWEYRKDKGGIRMRAVRR